MNSSAPRSWLRRRAPDVLALVGLLGGAVGLLAWRNAERRGSGGLTRECFREASPAPGATPLDRQRMTEVDLDLTRGPRVPRGTALVRYRGWLWVPFRGHFVYGLRLRGEATLTVGAAAPIRGRSGTFLTRHRQRVPEARVLREQRLLPRGWHPVTVAYRPVDREGELRLLWQPPGRRGDPEIVPLAWLRPAGAAPRAPPTATPHRRDFWVAWALFALLAIALGVWSRRGLGAWVLALRRDPSTRLDALAVVTLVVAAAAVRLWGLGDAGQTWDEDVYFGSGRNYWMNLLALDVRPGSWAWNLEHPPVTKYLVGLGGLWSEGLGGAHGFMALLGALVVVPTYLLGRELFRDRRVGALAALLVAALPALVAHSRIGGHETPSVLLYTTVVLCAWRGLAGATPRWGATLLAGGLAGLAVGARLINVTVLALPLGLVAGVAWARRRDRLPPLDRLAHLVTLFLVAGAVFFLVWPRLWHHPVYHLGVLLTYWPPGIAQGELFFGRTVTHSWAYFPVYLAVTAPVAVLAGLLLFGARLGRHRTLAEGATLLWLVVPLLIIPLVPFCRDGVRYVLPATVALALAAAVGGLWALDALTRRLAPTRRGAVALLVAALLLVGPTAWATWRFQPYQLDYYNVLAGGPEAALKARRFEWSWWGEGLAGGVRYINRHGPPNARVGVDVPARHTMVLLPDMRTMPPNAQPPPDYLLMGGEGLRRLWDARARRWRHPAGYRVAHEERAAGVVLLRVYRRSE